MAEHKPQSTVDKIIQSSENVIEFKAINQNLAGTPLGLALDAVARLEPEFEEEA